MANTLPDVNADEILAQLDDDTRSYLRVLLNAGGAAFDDEASGGVEQYGQTAAQDLREAFKRFEPTARLGNKLTRLLARRRGNIRRVIHNFQEFSTALAGRDRQLAALVDSANANFEAFASEETALREALQLFPGALDQTETTLTKTGALASELGPGARAAAALRPQPRSRRSRRPSPSSARPRRSSATRSVPSPATFSPRCATCAARPASWASSRRA